MTLQNIDENFAKANEASIGIQKKIKEYTANMLRLNESLIPWRSFFNSFQEKAQPETIETTQPDKSPEKNDKMQNVEPSDIKEEKVVNSSLDETSFINQTQNKTLTPPVLHTQNIITPSIDISKSISNSSTEITPTKKMESSPQYPSGLHMTFIENDDTTVISSKRTSTSTNLSTPPVAKRQETKNECKDESLLSNSSLSTPIIGCSENHSIFPKDNNSPESPPMPELKYFKSQ